MAIRAAGSPSQPVHASCKGGRLGWKERVEGKIKGGGTIVPILRCLHDGCGGTRDFDRRAAQLAKALNRRVRQRADHAGDRHDTPLYEDESAER